MIILFLVHSCTSNCFSLSILQFLSSGFVVMLFHYDGIVDEWKEFQWSDLVIHVSAINQTKWYDSILA